jgi:hypothetical protein
MMKTEYFTGGTAYLVPSCSSSRVSAVSHLASSLPTPKIPRHEFWEANFEHSSLQIPAIATHAPTLAGEWLAFEMTAILRQRAHAVRATALLCG